MEISNIEITLKNEYDSFTRIFNNWYIVVKEDDGVYMGIVDSNNNPILSIEKGSVFANDRMIFINREKSFVWDSNGQYINEPEEDVLYKPSCGIHRENGHWQTFYPKEIIVYTFRGDNKYNLHLFVPGKQPSKDSVYFRNIEKINDHLFKIFSGETSILGNKLFGVLNEFGNVVLSCSYQDISEQNGIFYLIEPINIDGSGYINTAIDRNGHVLINTDTCSQLQPLEDGYIIYRNGIEMGLLNSSFNVVIPATYLKLEFVKHNVLVYDDLYNIDYENNPLIFECDEYIKLPSEYCNAYSLDKNRYRVDIQTNTESRTRCGLIDIDNNILMPFIYDFIYSGYIFNKKIIVFEKDGKSGIADIDGRILLENKYDKIEISSYLDTDIMPSFAQVWNLDKEGNPLYGLISSDFSEILPPIHQVMRSKKEDVIVFMFDNIWGVYSFEDNSTKILHGYSLMRDFSEGQCVVCNGGEFRWYERDEDCDFYISRRYPVVINGKWGVIDKKCHQTIPCIYDAISPFNDGKSIVRKNKKRGLIDTNGNIIIPLIYDDVEYIYKNVYIVHNDNLMGYISLGEVNIECKYTDIQPIIGDDLFAVEVERVWGIINKQNEIIIPINYARVEENGDATYTCYLDEYSLEYDIIDSAGNIVSSERIKEEKIDDIDDEFIFDPFEFIKDNDIEFVNNHNSDCSEDIP